MQNDYFDALTHWGRVTHICVSKLTIIASDNGLSPGRRQAIIQTNAGILLIWPLGTNFSEILIEIKTFSFKKMHLKILSDKWRPFCLGLNVLRKNNYYWTQPGHVYLVCWPIPGILNPRYLTQVMCIGHHASCTPYKQPAEELYMEQNHSNYLSL